MTTRLLRDVRALLETVTSTLGPDTAPIVDIMRDRMDGPLRVAVAGRVKAGKSTLLNALIGEELAPTDAGECTRMVTWYVHGPAYRVELVPWVGDPLSLRHRRGTGALEVDLAGWHADDVHHLEVEWPTRRLQDLTLIDTPGIGSISTDVSQRTHDQMTAEHEAPGEADAVIYLIRHLHPTDVDFLEAFRDAHVTRGATINAIGVVSRADEIGDCRVGALATAQRLAARYHTEQSLRRLCQVVVPIAGLLAQGAGSLQEAEFRTLRAVASAPADDIARELVSADRFAGPGIVLGLGEEERAAVLGRLGLFGVRLAVELIRSGRIASSSALADDLLRRSGLNELRQLLFSQFAARAQVLKARTVLAQLTALARRRGGRAGMGLLESIRDVQQTAHEFTEIHFVQRLRAGDFDASGLDVDEVTRVLGGQGPEPWRRLALTADSGPADLRDEALAAIDRWRRRAEDPVLGRLERDLAMAAVRSCETTLASVGQVAG